MFEIGAALSLVSEAGKLFAKKPNPNDWKRWKPGDAIHWTKNDGDSVENEAHNIQQYLQNNAGNKGLMDLYWAQVTPMQLQQKFLRAGYNINPATVTNANESNSTAAYTDNVPYQNSTNQNGSSDKKDKGSNTLIIVLIAVVLLSIITYLVVKSKK